MKFQIRDTKKNFCHNPKRHPFHPTRAATKKNINKFHHKKILKSIKTVYPDHLELMGCNDERESIETLC